MRFFTSGDGFWARKATQPDVLAFDGQDRLAATDVVIDRGQIVRTLVMSVVAVLRHEVGGR
jgi:hypothetical protein